MNPVLLELGPLTIHTYGLFMALAFMAGIGWTAREARLKELDFDKIAGLGYRVLFGAILGARLLYVLLNPAYFLNNPMEILAFWKGGLVFSGGFILAVTLGWFYMRNEPRKFDWMDAIVPGVALGQFIGRFGCFFAGCCYGKECDLPWAVTFTHPQSLAPLNVALHPTEIYHSLAGLSTFLTLLFTRKHLKGPGQTTGLFLMLFAGFRIAIEFFRADFRGELGVISVTQAIAACIMLTGLFILFVKAPKGAENVR